MTDATAAALAFPEFETHFNTILREEFDADGSLLARHVYDLIFAAPGTYANPAGTKGVAKLLLVYIWSLFYYGEKSAVVTQRLLQEIGLGDALPENWLQVYRDRG